ncbi:MAG: MFS transporter [Candidatus Natronoplasma sp.]
MELQTDEGSFSKFVVMVLLLMGALGVMGGGLVAPGLPTIGAAFDVPEEQVGLILSIYTLAAAISLPLTGYFIDSIGRRKVGLACLLIDGSAGLAIVFAPDFSTLLVLRFIQGIGIAGLMPVAMTVIGDLFSGDRRLKVMGYLSGTISLGAAVIPLVGGFLAAIDWKLVFMVYGFSLLLAVFLYFVIPETGSESRGTEFDSPLGYASSLFSALKIKDIRNVMIHSLALYFLLYALVTYLPIFLVRTHGFDEIFNGIVLSGQAVFSALFASRATFLANHFNWRKRAFLGFGMISLSFFLLPFWPIGSYSISFSFIFFGVGMGIVSPTIYNRVTHLSPPDLTGSVISIFNTMKYVGMTSAPLLIGLSLIFTDLKIIFLGVGAISASWALFTLVPDLR